MTPDSKSRGPRLGARDQAGSERRGSPAEQLRIELLRLKRHGITFSAAWKSALARIEWPPDGQTRKEWRVAVDGTRAEWERCYNDRGIELNIEQVVSALAEGYDTPDPSADTQTSV